MSDNDKKTPPPLSTALVKQEGAWSEMAKEATKDFNDFAKESGISFLKDVHIPFIATFFTFVGWSHSRYQAWQLSHFFYDLSKYQAFGDVTKVIEYIEANIHKKNVADAFVRGWRTMLDIVDDCARKAANAMVADYMFGEKKVDLMWQQLGGFLRESDKEILAVTLELSDALEKSKGPFAGIMVVREGTRECFDLKVHLITTNRGDPKDGKFVFTPTNVDLDQFSKALEVLMHNYLVSPWTTNHWVHPQPDKFETDEWAGMIGNLERDRWTHLRKYIEPLRAEIL